MKNISWHPGKVLRELLPAFVFFFAVFHMLSASRALVLKEYGIEVPASAVATIGALIMAKVLFLMDKLPFLNLYPRKPLFSNVVVKTIAFSLAACLFFIIEQWIRFGIKAHDAGMGWHMLVTEMNWPPFWLRQAWLTLFILFYCAAVELIRVIGISKTKEIFFGIFDKGSSPSI